MRHAPLAREPRDGVRQVLDRDAAGRSAVDQEVALPGAADSGERGRAAMGAALGAARNVDNLAGADQPGGGLRDSGAKRAGGNFARAADRRARTGDHAPARIVWVGDEAELFGGRDERRDAVGAETDKKEHATGC